LKDQKEQVKEFFYNKNNLQTLKT